jgi:hypothetical protein
MMKKSYAIGILALAVFVSGAFCQDGLLKNRILKWQGPNFVLPYSWYNDVTYSDDDPNWCIWGAMASSMLYNTWPEAVFFSGAGVQHIPNVVGRRLPYYFNFPSLLAAWPAGGSLSQGANVPLAAGNFGGFTRSATNSLAINETTRLYYCGQRATGLGSGLSGAESMVGNVANHPKMEHIMKAKLGSFYTQARTATTSQLSIVKSNIVDWKQPVMVLGSDNPGSGHAYWIDGFKTVNNVNYVLVNEAWGTTGTWIPWTQFLSANPGVSYPPKTFVYVWSQVLGTDGGTRVYLYYGDSYIPSSGGNNYIAQLEVKNIAATAQSIMYKVQDKAGTILLATETLTCNPGAVQFSSGFNFSVPAGTDYQKLTVSFGGNYRSFKMAITEAKY